MSDKTKRIADDARIAADMQRSVAQQPEEANHAPGYQCGHIFTDRRIIAAHGRRDHVTFYCEDCAPPEALAAFTNCPTTN
jgi:hypothetical protein